MNTLKKTFLKTVILGILVKNIFDKWENIEESELN